MSAHVTALHHLAHALKKLAVVQQSLQGRKPDQTQARILIMHTGALGDTRKRRIQEKKRWNVKKKKGNIILRKPEITIDRFVMSTELLRPAVILIFSSESLFSCKHTCQAHSLASSALAGIGITRRFCKINAAYREGKHKSQKHCHLLVNEWKCMLVEFSVESQKASKFLKNKEREMQTHSS